MADQTLGETRVRTTFNPSSNSIVEHLKMTAASFIDQIDAIEVSDGEGARLRALAMTAVEEASMWAVKAATA